MRRKKTPSVAASVLALCFLLAANSFGQTTYTAASGYTRETMEVGFNFVGLTLHNPVVASGTIDSVTVDTTITDDDTNFSTQLGAAGPLYILRVLDGTLNGTVVEIASWSGNDLTTSGVTLDFVGSAYEIRKAVTIDEQFGTLLEAGPQSTADILWIPQPGGSYNRYFLFQGLFGAPEWHIINPDESTTALLGDIHLNYLDAFFVQIISTQKVWTLFGDVITTRVVTDLPTGFNAASTIFPVGNDLISLGLDGFMDSGPQSSADVLWSFNSSTLEWDRYFRFQGLFGAPEWQVIDNVTEIASTVLDPGAVELSSAVFIQRIGAATNGDLLAPPEYSTE